MNPPPPPLCASCRAPRDVILQEEPSGAGFPQAQRQHHLQLPDQPVLDPGQPQVPRPHLRPLPATLWTKAAVRLTAVCLELEILKRRSSVK